MKAHSWKREKTRKRKGWYCVGRTLSTATAAAAAAAAAVGTRISSLNDKDNVVLQGQTPLSLARSLSLALSLAHPSFRWKNTPRLSDKRFNRITKEKLSGING